MRKRKLLYSFALLVVTLLVFECGDFDLQLQDHFHDFKTHTWVVNAYSPVPKRIFYDAPRLLEWSIGLLLIIAACLPHALRTRIPWIGHTSRARLLAALSVIVLVPLLVGVGKDLTNIHTPAELTRYGGYAPYRKVLQRPSPDVPKVKRGRGFPAGHASGGFALMGLALLTSCPRKRQLILISCLAFGWIIGTYQMVKGVHFLSHTIISMLLTWIVFQIAEALLMKRIADTSPCGAAPNGRTG